MINVREVRSKKEQKEFLNFPLKMYKDCPYFAPPLYGDEKKIFRSDYVYYDTCEAIYFNAYDGQTMVGRISAILQRVSNEKRNEKRVRFTRFDSIDSQEVADALFLAVESWARQKGMDTVCGPLGFSDLEREGLLIEGFDQLSTFEEQYNYEYYARLISNCGYDKEVDWLERKIYAPKERDEKFRELVAKMMEKHELHFAEAKNAKDFIKRYSRGVFDLLDITYGALYGTVPFTDNTRKMMIDNFKLVIDLRHVAAILDKEGRVVCFGLCFPSLTKALQKSGGRLTPLTIIRVLRAVKRPEIVDLGLIGVLPEYAKKGIGSVMIMFLMDILERKGIKYAETNLNLEDNYNIQNQWRRFETVIHKKRRSYVKKLTD